MVCDVVVGTLMVPEAVEAEYRISVAPDNVADTLQA
jgi:hypothetical protein